MGLPGDIRRLKDSKEFCETHSDRRAIASIQGETDSMGCEIDYVCQECLDHYKHARDLRKDDEACCDWCHNEAPLRPTRDIDEGTSGRIYYVCEPCRNKQNKALEEELGYE